MKLTNYTSCPRSQWYLPRRSGKTYLQKSLEMLYNDLEDTLLAILAAGVPIDCISITEPKFVMSNIDYSYRLESQVKFIKEV